MMNRRTALQWTCRSAAACLGALSAADEPAPRRTPLGLVANCCTLRRNWLRELGSATNLDDPATFLRHSHTLGAGGIQIGLGTMALQTARALREEAESLGMFVEASLTLPRQDGDLDRFRAEMETAAAVGARAVRCVVIPGRRYEQFTTRGEFRQAEAAAQQMLERAEPIAARLSLPLAVENHKDQRLDERLRLLTALSSEFVGACIDTGNSLALLEDPLDTVRGLTPWVRAVHLKDQALQLDPDGFLLGDIPLGAGCLALPEIVAALRAVNPALPMCLELITRDPLRVPCLTDGYWSTLDNVPARDLARTLKLAQSRAAGELPRVSGLSPEAQVGREDEQIRSSLQYAREVLRL